MRKTDVLKTLFVCICVCHVRSAHPCGTNPRHQLEYIYRRTGMTIVQLEEQLRLSSRENYTNYWDRYQRYNQCMHMIRGGDVKRSIDSVQNQKLPSPFLETKQSLKEGLNSLLSERVSDDNVNALVDRLPNYSINTSVRSGLRETQQTQPNRINGKVAGLKIYTSLLERLLKSHMTAAPRTAIQDGALDTNTYSNIWSRRR